jgi:hypothetical protein
MTLPLGTPTLTATFKGVFSGVIPNEDYLDTVGHPDVTMTGLIVSIYNLGSSKSLPPSMYFCSKAIMYVQAVSSAA